MTFNEIMNSPLLYGLVGLGIVYIVLSGHAEKGLQTRPGAGDHQG